MTGLVASKSKSKFLFYRAVTLIVTNMPGNINVAINIKQKADDCRMDQEAAMLENDDLFDPENDIRDYDEIATMLPVFCVSSRAYQKKKQRLVKDDPIQGFPTEYETEVPQLQAHVKHLTEAGRASNFKQLLEEFGHVLNSLDLWSKDHSTEVQLSDGEKRDQVDKVLAELSTMCQVSHS